MTNDTEASEHSAVNQHFPRHPNQNLPQKRLNSISITQARPLALELVNMVDDLWHTAQPKSIPSSPHRSGTKRIELDWGEKNFSHESVKLSACASSKNLRCAISHEDYVEKRSGEWNRNTTSISFCNFKASRNNEARWKERKKKKIFTNHRACAHVYQPLKSSFFFSPPQDERIEDNLGWYVFVSLNNGGESRRQTKDNDSSFIRIGKLDNRNYEKFFFSTRRADDNTAASVMSTVFGVVVFFFVPSISWWKVLHCACNKQREHFFPGWLVTVAMVSWIAQVTR